MSYVPLWCKSNYSFLEGASHPEELILKAASHGLSALALTDVNGVYGLPRAHQVERELKGQVKLIHGAQLTLEEGHLVVLVADQKGWKNLCRLLTSGATRSEKGKNLIALDEIASRSEGLIALWGGEGSALYSDHGSTWKAQGGVLKEAFSDRLYALLTRHHLASQQRTEPRAVFRAEQLEIPLVAGRHTLYHCTERRHLQDVLTCIRHTVTLEEAGTRLRPNADYALLSPVEFEQLYGDRKKAVQRTLEVAERCEFSLSEISYRYPDEPLPEGRSSAEWLRELAFGGARVRYGKTLSGEVIAQIEKELSLINKLDYVGYFLTMYEIVCFCRERDILCQGRGSAANSVVCFCLGITAVDPIKLGLLFERFISEERAEPPDIDLDIAHQRREEVIAWVYDRYGRERAAMVCNVVRYRARSAVREVGKVLGVEVPVIERLAKLLGGYSSELDERSLEAAGISSEVQLYNVLQRLVNEIIDFPRHLSIHPGGFLIGGDPVCEMVPIENARMDGRTVIQWDKYDVESLGLFKIDLLGLGALSQLQRGFSLIREHRSKEYTMATIPTDDPKTYDMLGRGDSIGVFQVESRAQMAMLPVARPRRFYDLVIQVAIVRPGPITGGMVNPYLRRRVGEEPVDYPHPSLRPVLEKTLGVPLFQEQVMKLAMVAADYTPGEADQLRRDMAAWRSRGKIERHRERLVGRMIANGILSEFADRVFEQIKGFGEYGFPESHAASFALIAYATAYLRCHYLPEFMCSLLNSLPMGFYTASTLIEDARRNGVVVHSFCAEKSQWECTLEPDDGEHRLALRLGLKFLKGLRERAVGSLIASRPYRSARDLGLRSGIDRRSLDLLVSAGALECYGQNRRTQLWAAEEHLEARRHTLINHLPDESRSFTDLNGREKVVWDFKTAGMSANGHPMEALRSHLRRAGFPDARTVLGMPNGSWTRYAALVICRQRPATAKGTVFFTLEDETGLVNVIVWSTVFEKYFVIARSVSFLAVEGRLQSSRGVVHLVAHKLYRPKLEIPVELGSRDFH